MFIYSKISWYVGRVTDNPPVIYGYYHSSVRWNRIKSFYVDRWQIPKLIRYYKDNPDLGITIELIKVDAALVITRVGKSERINAEKLRLSEHKPTLIWPLSFCDAHFDVEANEDERGFTHVDIEEAVLYGIELGKAAGKECTDFIDGLSPQECAILYANEQEGT